MFSAFKSCIGELRSIEYSYPNYTENHDSVRTHRIWASRSNSSASCSSLVGDVRNASPPINPGEGMTAPHDGHKIIRNEAGEFMRITKLHRTVKPYNEMASTEEILAYN